MSPSCSVSLFFAQSCVVVSDGRYPRVRNIYPSPGSLSKKRFCNDVMAAILVFQNKETVAMLVCELNYYLM